jgi:hypothetical protein
LRKPRYGSAHQSLTQLLSCSFLKFFLVHVVVSALWRTTSTLLG